MIRWMKSRRGRLLVVFMALGASGIFVLGRRPALAQGQAGRPTGTADELRALVQELEGQVERQRIQLKMADDSLRRARALLDSLEGPVPGRRMEEGQAATSLSREEERKLPDQAIVEKREWTWSDDRTTPQASLRQLGEGYNLKIAPEPGKPWSLIFTLTHEGQADYSWEGHEHTVFLRRDNVLYRAEFRPGTTGCSVIAYDLKAEKPLWKTYLFGSGCQGHSQYRNRINLEVDDRHLTVFGQESHGSYIELLDLKTGNTVGHRLMKN